MRKQHSATFKAQIVVESLRETKTLAQIAAEHEVHPTLVTKWRTEALAMLPETFERGAKREASTLLLEQKIEKLYQEIGRLTIQVNWLKKNLVSNQTRTERLAMIERIGETDLPLSFQAELLSISRASLYFQPRPADQRELRLKRRLDELYTAYPFLGSRKVVQMLQKEGESVGRHTLRRYRAEMGLETLYPKPNLSKPGQGPEHKVYPYLLRGLVIDRPNQVWGVDITYIRLTSGWMYLVAFLDWYSRFVVAWELSDTLEIPFVLSCSTAALARATPEIVNSDQGSHFTTERFGRPFLAASVRMSMDGRGRYVDNIFTERLWRSVKYEEVYLTEYDNPRSARQGLSRYLSFYNERRPHQALNYRTPAEVFQGCLPELKNVS